MERFASAISAKGQTDYARAMGSSVRDSRSHVGHVTGSLVVQHLHGKNLAVRAHSGDADLVVGCGCRNARDMRAVSKSILDAAYIAVFAHNLGGQIRVSIVHARIDNGDHNN